MLNEKMSWRMKFLLAKNKYLFDREVEEEIKRRNEKIHAIKTLLMCNKLITDKPTNIFRF